MKHIYFSIFAYMLVATYCQAVSFTFNGLNYSVVSSMSRTCTVISGDSYSGDIVIPSLASYSGDEYKVIRVNDGAFRNCTKVNSVTIPESVTLVEHGAFDGCTSMSQLILKDGEEILSMDGVTTNGGTSCTFSDCPLESIYIGRNLTYRTADNYTNRDPIYSPFAQIMTLRSVYISDAVTNIPHSLFYHCEGLESVEGMKNVQSIDDPARATSYGVFQGCKSLKSFIIPDNITYVGDYAFADCTGLENMIVGNGISGLGQELINNKWIYYGGKYVFDNCRIENLYLGNNFTSIGKYSFEKASIKNLYMFTETPNSIVASVIPTSFNIYVVDTGKYSTLLKGYNVKELFTFNKTSTEYNGSSPELSYINEANNMNVSFVDGTIEKNVGSYTSNVGVKFCYDSWNNVISLPCNYTITKAPLSIIAKDKSVCYGEEIPNLDCTYIGFKNNETADYALSTLPTLVTSAQKGSNAGTYSINISGAVSKNYSLSYTSGILTIKKASQNITWSQLFSTYYIGDVVELNAISSCNLPISYKSSNENIAFVTSENGKQILHFVKDGTVKITATQSGNENYEAAVDISKSFSVIAKVATNITLNQSSIRMKEGEIATLVATIYPEGVIEKGVKWSSSNNEIVTVNNGVVTAIKVGSAIITASTIDGSNLEATCNVIVYPVLASAITLNTNSVSTTVGDSFILTYEIKPNNVTNKDVTWSSSNNDVATVVDGRIQTKSIGSAIISVKTTDGTNLTATCNVIVTPILVSSINLNSANLNLNVGEHATLSVTITPDNATNRNVEWYSSNSSVATISNGIVTAISSGSCVIKAKTTDGTELESSCIVTVADTPVSTISLDKESIELLVDETTTISASVYPANATNPTLSWTSSNGNVATVDDGLIMAQGAGTAVITVRTTDGTNKVAFCNVVVKKHQQTIEWNQDLSSITYGGELIKIHAEVSSGLPLVYSSSNDNVISVFDMGSVVYLNPINVGTSVITVKQSGNHYYEEISISKEAKVIDPNGIDNIMAEGGIYTVYLVNGLRVGCFSKDEYEYYMHNQASKGMYIVNGRKITKK